MRYPEFLKENGTIGFVAPSFGCAGMEPYHSRFHSALDFFTGLGYSTSVGENVFLDEGIGKSTTPEKCGKEINIFFLDSKNDIIISAGGGETMCEDLNFIDFRAIASAPPKWFMGYSDNTNLTFTLATLADTASIYGPCASSFGMRPIHPYLTDAFDLICGKKFTFKNYDAWEIESKAGEENPLASLNATEPFNMCIYKDGQLYETETKKDRPEIIDSIELPDRSASKTDIPSIQFSGRLLGGCLDILTILCGTKFDKVKEFNNKYADDGIIWFLEACDLNPVSISRSLWQLQNAGWFEKTKGFLIGRPLHINETSFGIDCIKATVRILKEHNVPIILNIDLGHLPPAMPIVSGAIGNVKTNSSSISIEYMLR